MSKKIQGNLMLLTTAMIWGVAIVAQRKAMDYMGPFTFTSIRFLIGGLVLIPIVLFFAKRNTSENKQQTSLTQKEKKASQKILIIGGIACGLALFVANSLQQVGLYFGSTAGKTGFITALYVVIVPLFGLFVGRKLKIPTWIGVALAVAGLYLLCVKGDFSIERGDFLVLLCAFGFAVHILVVDHFSPKADGAKMSCIQFFVCALCAVPPMLLFEAPTWASMLDCWLPILYAGIFSSGIAYTLQVMAQKFTAPAIAAILLSLESVFSVIAGGLLLHEVLLLKEIIGCILMFAAVILAQLPSKEERLAANS